MDASYASSALLRSSVHRQVDPVFNRTIITGTGTVPATVGTYTVGANLDLLNMPGSGFSRADLTRTTKIGSMKLLDANRLRVAIADVGEFRSESLLVFDVDLATESVSVLGTYRFNETVDWLAYSVHVMNSGRIVMAGHEDGHPFLVSWNYLANEFFGPVPYIDSSCGSKGLFGISLPILHGPEFLPESYSLLHSENKTLYLSIVGIRSGGESILDAEGNPAFGIALFEEDTLELISILPVPEALRVPDYFYPGSVRAGFIGSNVVQMVGYRRSACPGRPLRPVFDGLLRFIDVGSFELIKEINYSDYFGRFYQNTSDDIIQLSGASLRDGLDVYVGYTESLGKGLFSSTASLSFLGQEKVIAISRSGALLHVLLHGPAGLRLVEYLY